MLNSKEIVNKLKKTLIGQDEYAKQLAILGYKHELNQELIEKRKSPVNNNLLVAGETGTGKTFGAKQLAKILDIPFFEVDCSNIVQTGYKGTTTVEHILRDAKYKLGRGVEHSIIYLDEFDKVYDPAVANRGDGPAQMQNFLKIIEPNEVVIERERTGDCVFRVNTAGITYIATGSFDYVKKQKRSKTRKMGFVSEKEDETIISKEDMINAGFLPELVGRFGTIINLNRLDGDDYYRILVNSNESAYTQYKDFFLAADVKLSIDRKVFRKVADEAYKQGTGARGLVAILNGYLDDCVYEVSSDETIDTIELKMEKGKVVTKYSHNRERRMIPEKEMGINLIELLERERRMMEGDFDE